MNSKHNMEEEVETLRLQLKQALSHCSQDREELDRLRTIIKEVPASRPPPICLSLVLLHFPSPPPIP